ncbi:SAM-dependent methyltransferase [Phormidesmis priestleyi]
MIIQENSEATPKRIKWKPDIGYLPTPPQVVEAMLTLAEVTSDDILYDLGSGDGRILITAAQRFGTQGVGIDIDPKRVLQGFENAKQAGVSDRVTFRQQDLFESNFSEATIVILYLLPHLNLKLRPALFAQLPLGTRILSHDFDMGDWQPDRVVEVLSEDPAVLYLWTI